MDNEPTKLEIIKRMTPRQQEMLNAYFSGLTWQTKLATTELEALLLFLGAETIEFPLEIEEP